MAAINSKFRVYVGRIIGSSEVRKSTTIPLFRRAVSGDPFAPKAPEYIALCRKLESDPAVEEVLRNWPVRQSLLWV